MRSAVVLASLLFPLGPCIAQPAPAFVNGGVQAPGAAKPGRLAVDMDFFKGGVSVPGAIVGPASLSTPAAKPGSDVRGAVAGGPPAPPPAGLGPASLVPVASGSASPPPAPPRLSAPGGQPPPLPPDCVARGVDTILTPACMRYLTSEPPRLMRLAPGGDAGVADLPASLPLPPAASPAAPSPPAAPVAVGPALQCRVSGPRGREDPMTVLNPESCLRMASASMVTKGAYAVMMIGTDGNVVVVACDVPQDGDRPGCAVRP